MIWWRCLSSRPYVKYICARPEKGRTYRLADDAQWLRKITHSHEYNKAIPGLYPKTLTRPRPVTTSQAHFHCTRKVQCCLLAKYKLPQFPSRYLFEYRIWTPRQRLQHAEILVHGPAKTQCATSKTSRKRMEVLPAMTGDDGAIL